MSGKPIVVVGAGYVGLPLAVMLARTGNRVLAVDVDVNIVKGINSGVLQFAEDEVKIIFQDPAVKKNLRAATQPSEADVFIISVPTPIDPRRRVANLCYVISAVESILPLLKKGNLVIVESTIPPLTCKEVIKPILERTGLKISRDIFLCHCPERILPGEVMKEIVHNDRIVGGVDEKSTEMAREVYASFVKGNLYLTDDVTAELVKTMENTYRDVNIALANEFAAIAEELNVSPLKAIELANKHPRVKILSPGIGVGGHCIPKDPWFLKEVAPLNSQLIQMARKVNDEVPAKIAAKIRKAVKQISKPKIIIVGVAFKADTYDKRNSPALEIIDLLKADGYNVEAYDPLVEGYKYAPLKNLAKGADCLVLLVEHKQVKTEITKDEARIKEAMRHPLILRFYQT
jgi:UDP-N-acetyl-D-mannosaminuronic acid dehydrogenase